MPPGRHSFCASIAAAAFLAFLPLGSARAQESSPTSPSQAPASAPSPAADAVQVAIDPPLVDPSKAPTPTPPLSDDATKEQRARRTTHWYGWQTLAFDGVALATLTLGDSSATAVKAAIATYALGPMIVHIAHGRVGVGVGDMVLRVGAPTVLGLALFALGSTADKNSDAGFPIGAVMGAAFGVLAGCSLAIAVDAAVLAREPVPPQKTGFLWAPTVAPQKGGATFGLVGAF